MKFSKLGPSISAPVMRHEVGAPQGAGNAKAPSVSASAAPPLFYPFAGVEASINPLLYPFAGVEASINPFLYPFAGVEASTIPGIVYPFAGVEASIPMPPFYFPFAG